MLIIGCGGRGQALARDLVAAGHAVRGTTRSSARGGAIAVPPEVPLVVTEGNYLLVADGDWAGVRPLLDEAWYVEMDEETRLEWLIARHVEFGKTPDEARAWVMRSDQANAEVVAASRPRADLVVRLA